MPDEQLTLETAIISDWLEDADAEIGDLNGAIEAAYDKAKVFGQATLLITIILSGQ